jgi:hypothetical protein
MSRSTLSSRPVTDTPLLVTSTLRAAERIEQSRRRGGATERQPERAGFCLRALEGKREV